MANDSTARLSAFGWQLSRDIRALIDRKTPPTVVGGVFLLYLSVSDKLDAAEIAVIELV